MRGNGREGNWNDGVDQELFARKKLLGLIWLESP
jgi:hypothetical protein